MATTSAASSLAQAVLDDCTPRTISEVGAAVERGEVLRYLGYPAGVEPQGAIAQQLDQSIAAAARWAWPQAAYAVFPVEAIEPRRLALRTPQGPVEFRGAIGEFLGVARWIAAFVATAGSQLEHRASEMLQQGDLLTGMIYNAVGSERAEAAEACVIAQLRERLAGAGVALTLPYSPGYCGMALQEQRHLFALFGGEAVGVRLAPSLMMHPVKSISGLIGIGPAEQVQEHGSPCDRCELWTCNMRRGAPTDQ